MSDGLTVIAGPASGRLGRAIAYLLATRPAAYECRRSPHGEIEIQLRESVRGHDVYLIQSTTPPVEQHLIELLLLADACRRAGAARLSGVIPYFGYARQDRRVEGGALGGRVVADVVATAGFDRVMLLDVHTPAIEGFLGVPVDHLTAMPILAAAVATSRLEDPIVVAPDFGAVRLARAYAGQLDTPMAFVQKTRLDTGVVRTHGILGEVEGRSPIVIDDMLSTGATIAAAAEALGQAGARAPLLVAVTHPLFAGGARERLRGAPVGRLIVCDSVELDRVEPPLEIVSVAPLIAAAIRRHHHRWPIEGITAPAFGAGGTIGG